MTTHHPLVIVGRSARLALTLAFCITPGWPQQPGEMMAPHVHYASEFAASSPLRAKPGHGIVFHSEAIDPIARLELDAGAHRFCLDGGHEYFTSVIVEDAVQIAVPATIDPNGCARIVIPAGVYSIRAAHLEGAPPLARVTTLVTVDLPSPPLLNPQGRPRNGFWAIYPPSQKSSEPQVGRLRALPPYQRYYYFNSAMPVVGEYGNVQMDEYSLFQLDSRSPAVLAGPSTSYLDYEILGNNVFISNDGAPSSSRFVSYPLVLTDLKDASRFQLKATSGQIGFNPWVIAGNPPPNSLNVGDVSKPTGTFALAFRFFPDGTKVGALFPGEVAVYQQSNYTGQAAVYPSSMPNIANLASNATNIDKNVAAINFGPNTYAFIYPEPNYGGTPRGFIGKDPFVDGVPKVGSIQIGSLTAYMLSHRACDNCDLQGTDLSGLDLSGFSLRTTSFSETTLIRTKFNQAKLAGSDFTGAKMECTDFSGAGSDQLNDLTDVTFTNIEVIRSNNCRVNFSYTKLQAATISPQLWKYLDLTGAVFIGLEGKVLSSQAQPLDLAGAELAGTCLKKVVLDYADLQSAVLDGANLTGAHLTGAKLNSALLRHVNLQGAYLEGAQLIQANLDGANLESAQLHKAPGINTVAADLSGAFLRNVNLTQGKISGANFSNANFYGSVASGTGSCAVDQKTGFTQGCATADHAVMDNTNFGAANLFGVDFTSAHAIGANFQNAFLVGAQFSNATVSVDTSGLNTTFENAFLQGTSLAAAQMQNDVPFANAFLDFRSEGNIVTLRLSSAHTLFAGYWNTPGTPGCMKMDYRGPTTVPATGPGTTCADNKAYSDGCGPANPDGSNDRWESLLPLAGVASYSHTPTYPNPPDNTTVCDHDPRWNSTR